jgi:hypothetical protein
MEPIKCLLLLAAVLSFAAMNAAYDLQPGDDAETCARHRRDDLRCKYCCILLGKASGFQTQYIRAHLAWIEGQCICSRDTGPGAASRRPTREQVEEYEAHLYGEVIDPPPPQ